MSISEQILEAMTRDGLKCEIVTFRISEELESARDGEWNRYLSELQCVGLFYEQGYGTIHAQNERGFTVPVGHLTKKAKEEYESGIICPFAIKTLTYQDGEQKQCLDYYQQILLFTGELPDGAAEHYGIVSIAKGFIKPPSKKEVEKATQQKVEGCCGAIVLLVLLFILFKACF